MSDSESNGASAASAGKKVSKKTNRSAGERLHQLGKMRHVPVQIRYAFESGEYPYQTKLKRAIYEKNKAALQVELLKLQQWVEQTGEKVVVLFEG